MKSILLKDNQKLFYTKKHFIVLRGNKFLIVFFHLKNRYTREDLIMEKGHSPVNCVIKHSDTKLV